MVDGVLTKCKCGTQFINLHDYIECILCWYDRIFKRTLAGEARSRDRQ